MPFPFVAVTLPPETPPAYSAVLLDACTQAYPSGGCRLEQELVTSSAAPGIDGAQGASGTATPSAPTFETNDAALGASTNQAPSSNPVPPQTVENDGVEPDDTILGTVIWVDDNTAELLLGLPHWRNNRWLERQLSFKAADEPLERHRAVGFALGSLAGTVAEVAGFERESHDHETPEALISPQQSVIEKPRAPSVPTPVAQPQVPALSPRASSVLPAVSAELLVGLDAGSGFAEPRLGPMLGVSARFRSPWTLTLKARYAHEAISDKQVEVDYATIGISSGARFRLGWLEAHAALGGALDQIWIRSLAAGGKRVSRPTWWVTGETTFMPADLPVAPFLTLGAALGKAIDVGDVSGLEYGPLQLHAQLGLSLRFGLF